MQFRRGWAVTPSNPILASPRVPLALQTLIFTSLNSIPCLLG